MPDDAALTSLIRRAIADPGQHTPRRQTHEGWSGPEYESLPQWQARAVLGALGDAGYTVIPAAAPRECKHCGAEIVPCTGSRDLPVCLGWKHTQFIDSMLIGAHYCEGRSINPSAEPGEDEGRD